MEIQGFVNGWVIRHYDGAYVGVVLASETGLQQALFYPQGPFVSDIADKIPGATVVPAYRVKVGGQWSDIKLGTVEKIVAYRVINPDGVTWGIIGQGA